MKTLIKFAVDRIKHSKGEREVVEQAVRTAENLPKHLKSVSHEQLEALSDPVIKAFIKDPAAFKKLPREDQEDLIRQMAYGVEGKIMRVLELFY